MTLTTAPLAGQASAPVRIAYFAHELQDPAIRRRVLMLEAGGATVKVLGFSREPAPPAQIAKASVTCIGHTRPSAFLSRIGSVFAAIASYRRWAHAAADSDVIMARNLECLVIAAFATARLKSAPALHYEVLDIHRLMLRTDVIGTTLRALERKLLKRCNTIITSSPAYLAFYFDHFHPDHPPCLLVENKVFSLVPLKAPAAIAVDGAIGSSGAERPLVIGWFGIIRCRRSLGILKALVSRYPGRFEVTIRGKVADTAIPDFHETIEDVPGLRFLGPYKNPEDLPTIYGEVDLVWMIDFFEEGMNSKWLLPNRLYEGGRFGAVGVAADDTQSGQWVVDHNVGLALKCLDTEVLIAAIAGIEQKTISNLRQRLLSLDTITFETSIGECKSLVEALAGPNAVRHSSLQSAARAPEAAATTVVETSQ